MVASFSRRYLLTAVTAVSALIFLFSPRSFAQSLVPAYQNNFNLETLGTLGGQPTQMTFGPNGRLYIMTTGGGVHSFAYDRTSGRLSNHKIAVENVGGIGIAFHHNDMYLTIFDDNYTDSIMKLTDNDGNGVWGETEKGELRVKIVKGIPIGDHDVDQLIIKGDTLYVGIGRRTIAGRRGPWTMGSHSDDPNDTGFWGGGTGISWGDDALGGTICWIKDLNAVQDVDDSANPYGSNVVKDQAFYQENDSPYSLNRTDALLVHSAGTRNPFGLCLDNKGELWFTSNFNRTMTSGDGQANDSFHGLPGQGGDWPQPDFSRSIHDQLFHAVEGADYGYHDDNWRGKSPILPNDIIHPGRVYSTTFDNLFNKGPYTPYDPSEPVGLGPNSSSDGCSFFYSPGLPYELAGNIFIARYNSAVTENRPNGLTLAYQDLVAVDTQSGKIRRVAQGFNQPLCVLWDGNRRLLIGDIGNNTIYALYNVIHAPTVSKISPMVGPIAGGTPVTITGTGFVNGSTVKFGTVAATHVSVISATSITCHSPAESAGTVDVTVTTLGGTSATSSIDKFTFYSGSPKIQAVISPLPTYKRTASAITVAVSFINTGGVAATNFTLTGARLVSSPATAGLGNHGTIKANGGTINLNLTFPANAIAAGKTSAFVFIDYTTDNAGHGTIGIRATGN